MEIFSIGALLVSGLLLAFIGASRALNPRDTYGKFTGVEIENDANLLSELRGMGALMFAGGATILSGIFVPQMRFASFAVAAVIFFGFALGRVVSLRSDGRPNQQILQGLGSEIVLGSLNLVGLLSLQA